MKKFLTTLLALTVSSVVMADLVYDYTLNFKRIDAKYAIKKINKVDQIVESYGTTSDTISGYLVVPACLACDPTEGTDTYADIEDAEMYLVRKGHNRKITSVDGTAVPFVAYTQEAYVDAAIFGAYVNNTKENNDPLASIADAKSATMLLWWNVGQDDLADSKFAIAKKPGTDLPYGFLGFDNNYVDVYNSGFGSAKVLLYKKAGDFDFCGDTDPEEYSCQYVDSINGTIAGYGEYAGACNLTPMWDVCYLKGSAMEATHSSAAVSGTWNLKYNKKISESADPEALILKNLKATLADVFDADEIEPEP